MAATPEQLLAVKDTAFWLVEHKPVSKPREWRSIAKKHQLPPPGLWNVWLVRGGRGAGKTRTGAEYVLEHLDEFGSKARVAVGGPTLSAARDVCAEGDSGLITIAKSDFPTYNRSLMEARHVKGGYVKFMGAEEPGRWNGPQWTLLWADELALWNEESWHQARFGVRLGEYPRIVVTTTPKARKFVKDLMAESGVVLSHGTMYENPGVSDVFRATIERRYGGTRLGRQEIGGEYLEDVEGALWQRDWIEATRVAEYPPLQRVVVAIDPAVTANAESDETGICVAGKGNDGDFYVLACPGYRLSPQGWAERALFLKREWRADKMVAEANNGGDMVEATIRQVDPYAPLKIIKASRGKTVRAEPIAALYEQGRVHHFRLMAELEDQMCSFPVATDLDDRVDALVYALTELLEIGEFGDGGFEGGY